MQLCFADRRALQFLSCVSDPIYVGHLLRVTQQA